MPFRTTGSPLRARSQARSAQVTDGSTASAVCTASAERPASERWADAISAGSRLTAAMPDGIAKPLRASRWRRPNRGASTVRTMAR